MVPNGLCCAPYIFTKLLKPMYAMLRNQGHLSTGYIDDSNLQGKTVESTLRNILATGQLALALGFRLNLDKSVLIPTQIIEFLGFVIDSINMVV